MKKMIKQNSIEEKNVLIKTCVKKMVFMIMPSAGLIITVVLGFITVIKKTGAFFQNFVAPKDYGAAVT